MRHMDCRLLCPVCTEETPFTAVNVEAALRMLETERERIEKRGSGAKQNRTDSSGSKSRTSHP